MIANFVTALAMCGPLRAQEKNQMLKNSLTSVRHKIRKWSVTWGFSSRGIQRISSNFGANTNPCNWEVGGLWGSISQGLAEPIWHLHILMFLHTYFYSNSDRFIYLIDFQNILNVLHSYTFYGCPTFHYNPIVLFTFKCNKCNTDLQWFTLLHCNIDGK